MKILGKMGCLLVVETGLISVGFAAVASRMEGAPNLLPKGNPLATLNLGNPLTPRVSNTPVSNTPPQPPRIIQRPSEVIKLETEKINFIMPFLERLLPGPQGKEIVTLYKQRNKPMLFIDKENGRCIMYNLNGSFEFYDNFKNIDAKGAKTEMLEHRVFELLEKEIRIGSQEEKEEEEVYEGKSFYEMEIKKYKMEKKAEIAKTKTVMDTTKDCVEIVINFFWQLLRNFSRIPHGAAGQQAGGGQQVQYQNDTLPPEPPMEITNPVAR
ncbi:MAG: hypothetical protein LBG09_02540 [Puniceicoccales bacterium]|jgi:hypothetical protein|nr:hypothetical protein [Puniceicoccales bacterium]